jgi:hypothetical protein
MFGCLIGRQPIRAKLIFIFLWFCRLLFNLNLRRGSRLRLGNISDLSLWLILLIPIIIVIIVIVVVIVVIVVPASLWKSSTTATIIRVKATSPSPLIVLTTILLLGLLFLVKVLFHEVFPKFLFFYLIFVKILVEHCLERVPVENLFNLGWIIGIIRLFLCCIRFLILGLSFLEKITLVRVPTSKFWWKLNTFLSHDID